MESSPCEEEWGTSARVVCLCFALRWRAWCDKRSAWKRQWECGVSAGRETRHGMVTSVPCKHCKLGTRKGVHPQRRISLCHLLFYAVRRRRNVSNGLRLQILPYE